MNALVLLFAIWATALIMTLATLPIYGMLAVLVGLLFKKVDYWLAVVLVVVLVGGVCSYAEIKERETQSAFMHAELDAMIRRHSR